jgi:hypothetical protein
MHSFACSSIGGSLQGDKTPEEEDPLVLLAADDGEKLVLFQGLEEAFRLRKVAR